MMRTGHEVRWCSERAMGSYCSCPDKDFPDKHQSKFKVINVDDDGNELGSGLMELTEEELILYTRKRDTVKWPYLCLRRYGYDSNLFSFESGRRCQTGQGIFAFKCVRAEEMFNLLQDIMHNNSISVVEEQVEELNPVETTELSRKPHTAAAGYSVPTLPNGTGRYPSFGEASSRPSSRHPSVGSARLPSVGEESSHPLLVSDQSVHTYVNTPGIQDDRRTCPSSHTALELRLSNPETTSSLATAPPSPTETDMDTEPQVLLQPEGVKFILGPTPAQRRQNPGDEDGEAGSRRSGDEDGEAGSRRSGDGEMALGVSGYNGEPSLTAPSGVLNGNGNGCVVSATLGLQAGDCDTGYDSDERKDGPPPPLPPNPNPPPHPGPKPSTISTYEHHNGNTTHGYVSTPVPAPNPRRNRPAAPLPDSSHNANNSAQRRTALLNYENLPALPPVWETARRFSEGDEEDEEEVYHGYGPKTPSLNGYHNHHHHPHHLHHHGLGLDPMHNYVNTENVNVSLSAKLDSARILPRGRDSSGLCLTPTVFNFDFRSGRLAGGPCGLDPLRQLNYIELEMGSDSSGPQTPKTPTTPCGVGLGSLLLPPSTPTRRTELYAMIDIERTAAMSSLQKALPRDDGTSRKTRHNSTDLPM
ncbi:fibroblast growth factor receptor substrate 2a isoform X1 [Salvelinus fontinalis]|uniref:fibroblast growth factor receptor substrate 2a isoform X1 n=2 Tax=Salvelinus fontinalis TaxID=8038 RepID=UPI002485181E|nr:fibroblast growth factor receptor substrate 2a isoform X1 [Salvelinus fontinalis]